MAEAQAVDASTVLPCKKKQALPLHDDERASEGMARRVIDDEEDRHSRISDALAAFVAAHKLDVNIFCSTEWDDVLEAVNDGPMLPSTCLL